MSSKENHAQKLTELFNAFLRTSDDKKIREYLRLHSNLPGPRGNLELADVFAQVVESHARSDSDKMWVLCQKLINVTSEDVSVNTPQEFPPFCGALGLGTIGSVSPVFFEKAFTNLQESAQSNRWRMREAVAMAIQKLIIKKPQETLKQLELWVLDEEWLVMRAAAAGVAEPALLKDNQTAKSALQLHKKIFAQVLATEQRKSEEFKVLKMGLGYTLSVVVAAIPEEGFKYLRILASSMDADVLWILRENLRKNRLVKNFPKDVAELKKAL